MLEFIELPFTRFNEIIGKFSGFTKINTAIYKMGSKMNEWHNRIQRITSIFDNEFGGLPEEDLNWKSSESKWSIAQIMQHIITTNRSYFPLFNLIKNNKFNSPWIGKFPPLPSFMGKMILSYVRPDMKKKSKTVEIWEPSYSIIPVEILNRFKLHQEEFMQWIDLLDEYFDTNLIIRSPASRIIVYSLDTAIEIMVAHEERHLNQARDVLRVKDQ